MIVTGELPLLPRVSFGNVDVRNVAEAHLKAILVPEAANKRFILWQQSLWFEEIAAVVKDYYGSTNTNIPTRRAPKLLMTFMSLFQSELKHTMKHWDFYFEFDNSPSKNILGIEYIDARKSIREMIPSLIATGYMPGKRQCQES